MPPYDRLDCLVMSRRSRPGVSPNDGWVQDLRGGRQRWTEHGTAVLAWYREFIVRGRQRRAALGLPEGPGDAARFGDPGELAPYRVWGVPGSIERDSLMTQTGGGDRG